MESIDKLRKDNELDTKFGNCSLKLHTTWGLFSSKEVDPGTQILINNLKISEGESCLDFGCGYGVIGLYMAKESQNGEVHLIDKDFIAIEYSKKNSELNRIKNTKVYLSNGLNQVREDIQFDTIASNLPAKVGKEFFTILLHDVKAHLKDGGKFYVVTIAGLKDYIKRNFKEVFGNYEKVDQSRGYTVALAIKNKKVL